MGAAAAITLRLLLPWWMYLIISVICCVVILMEIGTLACWIVRHERRMEEAKEHVERRNQ